MRGGLLERDATIDNVRNERDTWRITKSNPTTDKGCQRQTD